MKRWLMVAVTLSVMYGQTFIPVGGTVNRIIEGNGYMFVSTSQGAYAIQDTSVIWSRNYGGETYAARDSNFIYLLEPSGRILKINPDDLNDTTVLAESNDFDLLRGVGNTFLFVESPRRSSRTTLYAINKITGNIGWSYDYRGNEYTGYPAIFGDTIYVGGSAGILKAIADGNVLWSISTTGCYVHSRAADSTTIYFTDACGHLNAINRFTGEIIYSNNLGFGWITGLSIDDTLGYLADWGGTAICVNILTGNVVWSTNICGGVNQPPYIGENYVYYSCFNDHIYVLDKNTGSVINDLNAYTGIDWSPLFVITPSGLYVNGENTVVKFDINDRISDGFWPCKTHDNWWTSNFNISGGGGVTNILSIASAYGVPGENLHVNISLTNQNVVSGIQTTLVYDTLLLHFQNAELDSSIGNFSFNYEVRNDSVTLSFSGDSILPGSNIICHITFLVDSNAHFGDSTYLELSGTVLRDPAGNQLPVFHSGGWVYIRGTSDENMLLNFTFDQSQSDTVINLGILPVNGIIVGGSRGPGINGNGVDLSNYDDRVEVPSQNALNLTGDFTISLWMNLSSWSYGWGGDGGWIISKLRAFDNYNGWMLKVRGDDNKLQFGTYYTHLVRSNQTIDTNRWYHIAVVGFDSGNVRLVKIYINGSLDSEDTIGQFVGNTHPLWIGAHYGISDREINGIVDEIRIYSRALDDQEVRQLYEEYVGISEHGPKVGNFTATEISLISKRNSLSFEIELPYRCDVTFKMYDPAGRMILENKDRFSAGKHTVYLPIGQIKNGVYFLKITTSRGETLVKKLVILR